ncbi:FAD dependent oxidoreductase superfamily [Paramyrothecium foliicola]|nr:FAD dependent oxidoreductase superfamily [Paramyrothecium foliicola]
MPTNIRLIRTMASLVASSPPTIIVIGAGIIGLTCALKLQEAVKPVKDDPKRRPQVLLVSREWPVSIPGAPVSSSVDYASMWAGAHVRPVPATTPQLKREARWLKKTVAEFQRQLEAEPWAGIAQVPGIELLESPDEGYLMQNAETFGDETGLPGYRKFSKSELPAGVELGYEYETYCINAPLYCAHLLRQFILQGGVTMKRSLKTEWEAYTLRDNIQFVVNASGSGFSDAKSFPIRGQTVVTNLVSANKTVTRQHKDETWSFIIPRSFGGGTIFGGTKERGDLRTEPDLLSRTRLLSNGAELIALATGKQPQDLSSAEKEFDVVADIVGRRPAREDGVRIEMEEKEVLNHDGLPVKGRVIHAYGAGGRGYELSWGIATEVVQHAEALLDAKDDLKSKL